MFPINQRVCFHFFVNTCNVPSSSKLQVHKEEEEESGGGGGNQEVVKERMVAPLSLIRTRLPALPTVEPSLRLSTPPTQQMQFRHS